MGGWNGSSGASSASAPKRAAAPSKKPAWLKGLAALLIIAALGGGVIYFLMPGDAPVVAKEKTTKPGAITEVKPAPAAATNVVRQTEAPVDETPVFTDGRTSEWSKKFSKNSTWKASTNSFGKVIEIVHDGGQMHKRISDAKPPMFNNASDQALAMATAGGGMGPLPPIPIHPQAEAMFRESLQHEIVINDDDSDEVKQRKTEVIRARAEMKEALDAGESFANIINSTVEQRNADYSLRQEARSSVANLLNEDPEGAEELMAKYNEVLRKNGIAELKAEDFESKGPARNKENK